MKITTEYQYQAMFLVRALEESNLYVEYDPDVSGLTLYTGAGPMVVEALCTANRITAEFS